MRTRPIAASLLGLLAASCHDSPSGPADPCVLRDCDVREADCHEHVAAVLACIRGAEHPLPAIEVLTASEYAEKHPPAPPRTPEEQKQFEQLVRAYVLLGWLAPDWTEPTTPAAIEAPYFSYDFETGTVTIIADGSQPQSELYSLLYVLGLAARDSESDIHGLSLAEAVTFDSKRALASLYAGEATLYADLAWIGDSDYEATASRLSYLNVMNAVREQLADVAVPWGAALSGFTFYFGANYVLGRYLDGGPEAVTAAYDDALASTAHALGGDVDIDAAFSAIDTALPEPPPGFTYLVQDSYGPVLLQMHRVRRDGVASTAFAEQNLAREWVGDRLVIAASDTDERVAVVWQIAGPGGEIAETIVLADDDDTLAAFESLFPAP
ncbi:hypothetical protein [Nannocystis sp. SCPEA4]|uniref:hypothetical protein n=1 Tax=Nannocystis sp. SCPEA4 TaxID=2996787 RepID=UPI0022721BD7|nr:hypothetical protein [Nannocystis sp. SCPEA4]MCY1059713.1 hypothetical protein [Nannocystis sp. SCPEA4]